MTPGPNFILRLPHSGTLVKIATVESDNTFGARYWTDGKRQTPMSPDIARLRRHLVTDELFWIAECQEIAREAWVPQPEFYGESETTNGFALSFGTVPGYQYIVQYCDALKASNARNKFITSNGTGKLTIAVPGNIGTGGARHSVRAVAVNQKGWLATTAGRGLPALPDGCANVKFNSHTVTASDFAPGHQRIYRLEMKPALCELENRFNPCPSLK